MRKKPIKKKLDKQSWTSIHLSKQTGPASLNDQHDTMNIPSCRYFKECMLFALAGTTLQSISQKYIPEYM